MNHLARWALISVVAGATVACGTPPDSSSSSQASTISSSNISSSSSSSSSSVAPSSISSSSSLASIISSSSSTSSVKALSPIVARTDCPKAPPASKSVDLPGEFDLDIEKSTYVKELVEMPVFQGKRTTMPWHLYTPPQAANSDELLPLIVSLHGGYGREGADHHITQDGAPYMLASSTGLFLPENKEKYPTFIIFPHCLESVCQFYSNEWSSGGGAFFNVANEPSSNGSVMIEIIEHMVANYAIDPARVYVTGVSMGGGGTWDLIVRRPDLIAAAVPMAGHTPSIQQLSALGDSKVPVWAHISTTDNNNPGRDTKQAVKAIQDAGGCAWYSEYEGIEHSHKLWQRSFLNTDLWPWLFAQKQPREGDS